MTSVRRKTLIFLFVCGVAILFPPGCVPFDKIYSHEFNSGLFNLKSPNSKTERVYVDPEDDSIYVYPLVKEGKKLVPDRSEIQKSSIESVLPGNILYGSTFIKTSADVDLSTVLIKFRPASADVSPQMNSNVNAVLYTGFRKDFFRLKLHKSPLGEAESFLRHTGFDLGLFAGIGITPVNPTVTMNRTIQEYDGIVFQKGIALFGTFENLSVGFALGFDNLLNRDRKIWIYNQHPWLGLVLGIANF